MLFDLDLKRTLEQ